MSTLTNWTSNPITQYAPIQQIRFAPYHPVMPERLPPSAANFTMPWANQLVEMPPSQAVYNIRTSRRPFV